MHKNFDSNYYFINLILYIIKAQNALGLVYCEMKEELQPSGNYVQLHTLTMLVEP